MLFDTSNAISKNMMSELQVAIKGPLAWSGADFEDGEAYTLQLHDEDIEEINAALQSFKGKTIRNRPHRAEE